MNMNMKIRYQRLCQIFKNDKRLNKYVKPNPKYIENPPLSGYFFNEPYLIEPQELVLGESVMIDVFDILINKKIKKIYLNEQNTYLGIVTDNSTFYFSLQNDDLTNKKIIFNNLKKTIDKKIEKTDFEINEINPHHVEHVYKFITVTGEILSLCINMKSVKKRRVSYIYDNCCEYCCDYDNCCCDCEIHYKNKNRRKTWETHKPSVLVTRFITDKIKNKDLLRCYFDKEILI